MVRRAKIFCRHFIGGTPRKRTADIRASQRAVWDLLSKIRYGEVVTYKELAGEIARQKGIPSMSTQAIGGAVGHNPISIIIPCHRVVGSDGSLTGYAGGIDKKRSLLTIERAKGF